MILEVVEGWSQGAKEQISQGVVAAHKLNNDPSVSGGRESGHCAPLDRETHGEHREAEDNPMVENGIEREEEYIKEIFSQLWCIPSLSPNPPRVRVAVEREGNSAVLRRT
jgi:hypothetical protein